MILISMMTAFGQTCLLDSQCDSDEICAFAVLSAGGNGQCTGERVHLRNEDTDECMRPTRGRTQSGVRITMDTCIETASRDWWVLPQPNGTSRLMNDNSRLCLEAVGNRYEQRACTGGFFQDWVIDEQPNGSVRLFQAFMGLTCIRGHVNVADPFRSDTCSIHNNGSRHWFMD